MVGKSPITADGEQRAALRALTFARPLQGRIGRGRCCVTLLGWTSPRIGSLRRTRGRFACGVAISPTAALKR